MARSFGRVSVTIWDDPDFLEIAESAQRLYLMLVSFVSINNAGVLPMTLRRWAKKGPKSTPESVRDDLQVLADARFIGLDDDTEEVLVRTFIRNDGIASQPQMLTNGLRAAVSIESPHLRRMLAVELRRLGLPKADATAAILDPDSPPPTPPPASAQPVPSLPDAPGQPAGSLNGLSGQPEQSSDMAVDDAPIQAPRSLREDSPSRGGVGVGEGEGVKALEGGGFSRTRTREEDPPPPTPIRPRDGPVAPCGWPHPDDQPCRQCQAIRLASEPRQPITANRHRQD